ncbi:SCP-domain-containing protein [Coemansia reversa NRRL 1564]|uniref:SCP-domain-containing protein n=1 Tax=Coemansia reversa (strain ATCC 12441 / NRRL 1564) TaxID=763665 RepID=A0A2G5B7N4_COERN|nr:SCP-domain-containing protein [Coemansia reversa NRRL 1564]|eukprot:PIA15053.1 SCP-domain-containing protein [Coemansia reversa NRRL 1564]
MKLLTFGSVMATATVLLSAMHEGEAYPVRLERRDPVTQTIHYVLNSVNNGLETVHSQLVPAPSDYHNAPPPPTAGLFPPTNEAQIERQVLCLVNKERQRVGLNTLSIHPALTQAAKEHSTYQSQVKAMTHTDTSYGALGSRLERGGFSFKTAAENIAEAPAATAQDIFNMWRDDPPHYKNIVDPSATYMGVACVNGFWTQDFGSSKDLAPPPSYAAQDTC